MRVVIATLGTRGDVQPMLALAQRLQVRGHAITFCGPTDARPTVDSFGLPFVDLGLDVRRFLDEHPEFVGGRARSLVTTKKVLRELIDRQFHALEPLAGDADLIVGAGLMSAPSSIAEAKGVPYRFVAFGAMAIPSRLHPPYLFPVGGLPARGNLALWRLADVVLGVLAGDALNAHRRRLGLRPTRRPSQVLTPPGALLLAADPELSPPPLDYDPTIPVTGALRGPVDNREPLPPSLEAFLTAGPPPVFIGFGSMTNTDPSHTTHIIVDAITRSGARALISSGWAGLGAALPHTCLAIGEVSHDALFPRLAGVVHHGGAGTTATAARAGVPQLVVPHLLDQFYWADRVTALGIGPRALAKRSLSATRLATRLVTMATDTAMRATASALGRRLCGRDGIAAAVEVLESKPAA